MPAVTLAQQCRFRHVLTCVCLIVLLGLLLGSSPTLVTAKDEPTRDGIVPLPEGAQQAEFELAIPVPVAAYVDPVGPSERPREAVVEVSVEVPLDDGAVAEHDVLGTPQADADAADAEGQSVIEETRVAEASREAVETRRDVQAEREDDRRFEENEKVAAEAQGPSEEAAAQRAVETQMPFEAAMKEGSFPSTTRLSTEENGAQPSGSGAFHSADRAEEAAAHDSEQSPPPVDSVMEVEPSSSPGAATLDTHLSMEEVGKNMAEATKRAEAQIAAEVQQTDKAPHLKMRKAAEASKTEEAKQLEETGVAQELEKAEQVRIAEEAARQAEAERQAEATLRAEEARKDEEERLAEERRKVEEARQAQEAQRAEETRLAEEARQAQEAQRAEETRLAEEARQAQEAQRAEETRLAEEARLAQERRLAAEAQRAQEEARIAETRRAEKKRQADAAAASALQRRKVAAEAQSRLNSERKKALAKIDDERARFQTAAAELTTQQEEEKSSAARREKAVAAELQKTMEKKLEALQHDLVTLGHVSVTLRDRVSELLRSSTSLTQVQEDVQVLDGMVVKAGETLDSIREATDSLADAARAAVGHQKDAPATTAQKITLLAKQKMELETAHDAAIQHLLARLQILDSQLAGMAEPTETEEAAVAGPAEAAEGTATPPLSPVTAAAVGKPKEVAPLPSEAPRPVGTSTIAPAPSAPRAEPWVNSPRHAEESPNRYRRELIETPANQAGEEGYSEDSYEVHLREGGAPCKVNRHMEIVGTAVVITIAATVQTLRWCRSGCRGGEEEDEETSKDVTPELQARETSSASPHKSLPQSGGPLQQRPQASPPSTFPPQGANATPDRGGMESPSRWESGSIAPPSQRGTPSASSEQMRLLAEKGDTLSPTPVPRHHSDGFPLGAPVPGKPGVTRRPPHGTSPLDTARAPPPPPGATSPFTPSRNETLGMSPTPVQRQLPLPGGQFGDPSPPPLSGHPPMAGTPLQMHRRRNNGDDFELHNPFLSRWS
ncbi:conserved hypothetical protein [Leishmania mexicana MHOM/GT/2001/U1103]|uniref:Kinetoplast-associated protein-like protein n=1 Tax=Leishmania mexicana (strain MHOM/GT/2001/U1103) TaxID=929439 RepID=E9B5E6_LEIMU|nr:conserved hypothetical protein [Leishmania mexicana MHOM/GT/2001/U1103]CBZ30466.1 conserved hypothetical protein [Leishmania mexicana MHOM/GT/2001/U1103]